MLKKSHVTVKNIKYIMGAPEFVLGSDLKEYEKMIEKYSNNRVLVLVSTKDEIIDKKVPDKKEVLALILIKDKIRKEAIKTLEYFMNKGVDIKVISGDSKKTIETVAREVGINIQGVYDAKNIDENTPLKQVVNDNNRHSRQAS